jgi:hypothetical protein
MVDYQAVCEALESHLQSLPGGLPSLVAWPNGPKIDPSPVDTFFRVTHFTAEPVKIGTADNEADRVDGFTQVDIYIPVGSGTKVARDYIRALSQHFSPAAVLDADGIPIKMKYTEVETNHTQGAHYMMTALLHYVVCS